MPPLTSSQRNVEVAKKLDQTFQQVDKNNDRAIDYDEFSKLSIPGLNNENTKRETFNQLAKASSTDSSTDKISEKDISAILKSVPEKIDEAMLRIGNRLVTTQAKASEATIDLFLAAGGKTDKVFEEGKLFTTAKNVMLQTFARTMGADASDPIVNEAVEKSSLWISEKSTIRSAYFDAQEKIFKDIDVATVQKMVNIAVNNKDYQGLSSLDFSLARFASGREELSPVRVAIGTHMKNMRTPESEAPVLSQVRYDLHMMNELNSRVGESFISAANEAGINIQDQKLTGEDRFSVMRDVRAAELMTMGVDSKNISKELPFDPKYTRNTSELSGRYDGEVLSVFKSASAEQLIETYRKLVDVSPVNADSIFKRELYSTGMPLEHARSLYNKAITMGFKADPFSDTIGNRFASVMSEFVKVREQEK